MAEEVTDPDGRAWVVRRRWMPRLPGETLWARFRWRFRRVRRRTTQLDEHIPDVPLDIGDGPGGILAAIALLLALVVLVLFVLPLFIALVEVAILVALALVAIGARILFRRPWTVEAAARDGEVLSWQVVGWRASGDHARVVARQLRRGLPPGGAEVGRRPDRTSE